MENMKSDQIRAIGPEGESQERIDDFQLQPREKIGEEKDRKDDSKCIDNIHEPSHSPKPLEQDDADGSGYRNSTFSNNDLTRNEPANCPYCGGVIQSNTRYCWDCGKEIRLTPDSPPTIPLQLQLTDESDIKIPMSPASKAGDTGKISNLISHASNQKRITLIWVLGTVIVLALGIIITSIVLPPIVTLPYKQKIEYVHQQLGITQQQLGITQQQLGSTKQELGSTKQELGSTKQELGSTQQELGSTKQELESTKIELQQNKQLYDNLNQEYSNFQDISIQPPYITISARIVYMTFYKRDRSLIYWSIPFDSLESSIENGFIARSPSFGNLIYVRCNNTNTGEVYRAVDFRPFVDSSPFTKVINDLYNESANDSQFISEVWNIVTQLTTYSTVIGEIPRYPLETLLAGGGDCDELAVLFASLIKAAPVNFKIELVYMDGDNPTNPQKMNHVVVKIVEPGGNSHIVETTSASEMEPYDNVRGWYFTLGT